MGILFVAMTLTMRVLGSEVIPAAGLKPAPE